MKENLKTAEETNELTLQIGMKVKIKNKPKEYFFNSGKAKTITSYLPNFGSQLAYGLDGDDGIWCVEDFECCLDYPNMLIKNNT